MVLLYIILISSSHLIRIVHFLFNIDGNHTARAILGNNSVIVFTNRLPIVSVSPRITSIYVLLLILIVCNNSLTDFTLAMIFSHANSTISYAGMDPIVSNDILHLRGLEILLDMPTTPPLIFLYIFTGS